MREQATVFGEVAELYDKARAGYSDELVDTVLEFAEGSPDDVSALEVGAGTGKATVAFAARGLGIVALEPDPAMASVAMRNCATFPRVRIDVTTFEAWRPDAQRYGLLFSAQAWHWVDPEVRWTKAASVLVPGGTVAILWHRTDWRDEELRAGLEGVYRMVAPDLFAKNPSFPGLAPRDGEDEVQAELAATALFTDLRVHRRPWSASFTADAFVDLLSTQSDHRLVDERQRTALFDAVRELIAAAGGEIEVPHATALVLARNC